MNSGLYFQTDNICACFKTKKEREREKSETSFVANTKI